MKQYIVKEDWSSRTFTVDLQEDACLLSEIQSHLGISPSDFYLTQGGKFPTTYTPDCTVHISLRLPGGKGGFGSLLRSMNPKKTLSDNFDSCRDLSGRRLRTVYTEQRMEEWKQRQEAEERYVREENERYQKERAELKGAIRANANKIDDKYKKQVQSGAALIGESVKQALSVGEKRRIKKTKLSLEELLQEEEEAEIASKKKRLNQNKHGMMIIPKVEVKVEQSKEQPVEKE